MCLTGVADRRVSQSGKNFIGSLVVRGNLLYIVKLVLIAVDIPPVNVTVALTAKHLITYYRSVRAAIRRLELAVTMPFVINNVKCVNVEIDK